MELILSTVYNLNSEQITLIEQVAKECRMSCLESAEALYMDGQLELKDCDLNYNKVLYVG